MAALRHAPRMAPPGSRRSVQAQARLPAGGGRGAGAGGFQRGGLHKVQQKGVGAGAVVRSAGDGARAHCGDGKGVIFDHCLFFIILYGRRERRKREKREVLVFGFWFLVLRNEKKTFVYQKNCAFRKRKQNHSFFCLFLHAASTGGRGRCRCRRGSWRSALFFSLPCSCCCCCSRSDEEVASPAGAQAPVFGPLW